MNVSVVDKGLQTLTDPKGVFSFADLPAGEYKLRFATVGYLLTVARLTIAENDVSELSVVMTPDTGRPVEEVEVRADPYQALGVAGPTAFSLEGNEIKNLASVLADDPLRSVHALPAVSSNDDFESRFSIHGAPYERIGLYLDGVLLHEPFHSVVGEGTSGSIAIFNAATVDAITLTSEGYPAQYGDRTAGILDVRTRDGAQDRTRVAVSAGAADVGVTAEGPIGPNASWVGSIRRSYLQHLLQAMPDASTMAFGFADGQLGLSYNLTRRHRVKILLLDGSSVLDRSHWQNQLDLNTAMLARNRSTVGMIGWRYAPADSLLVETHAAFIRERYHNRNARGGALSDGFYGEWASTTNGTWLLSRSYRLSFGGAVRRTRASGSAAWFDEDASGFYERYRGASLLAGGYAQQTWAPWRGRLELSLGGRVDSQARTGRTASPQASLAVTPWPSGRIQLSWGRYSQFPDISQRYGMYGDVTLRPERATHYVAAFDQRLGGLSRLRITLYRRDDRGLLFRSRLEARMEGEQITGETWDAPLTNSLDGYAQGLEIFVQRRSANRFTGWGSYSLGSTLIRDHVSGVEFPSDQDQRHRVNLYLGYRLRPSVNISARWAYGSGFPIPGYFRKQGDRYFLAAQRNRERLGPYQTLNLRINKSRAFDRYKLTIYGEVVNVFNRKNYRLDSYNGFDARTGEAYISFSRMFPVLPSAGVMLQF